MSSANDPLRRILNGLISLAAIAAVFVMARSAMERRGVEGAAGRRDGSSAAVGAPHPEQVKAFYDAAVRRIEDECGVNDKGCETRVKKEVAAQNQIPEDQATSLFFSEGLRRARQGR